MLLELEIDVSYVRQALRLIELCACAMVAESAMSETFFFSRKENLAKKIWPGRVSILGPGAWKINAFTTEPLGLWQFWSSNWVLILFSTVTVSIQRLPEGHLEKATETQALPGILIVLFYNSWLATPWPFLYKLRQVSYLWASFKLTAKLPTQPFRLVQLILVRMACYLYSEGESWPAIPACNCHYIGQSCCQLHTLFSTSRPSADLAA